MGVECGICLETDQFGKSSKREIWAFIFKGYLDYRVSVILMKSWFFLSLIENVSKTKNLNSRKKSPLHSKSIDHGCFVFDKIRTNQDDSNVNE